MPQNQMETIQIIKDRQYISSTRYYSFNSNYKQAMKRRKDERRETKGVRGEKIPTILCFAYFS